MSQKISHFDYDKARADVFCFDNGTIHVLSATALIIGALTMQSFIAGDT